MPNARQLAGAYALEALKRVPGLKNLGIPLPARGGKGFGWWDGGISGDSRSSNPGRVNWSRLAGDPRDNSALWACQTWMNRVWPEAPVLLWETDKQGKRKALPDHELSKLLARPNDWYSGAFLWQAILPEWMIDGNAYWYKVRNNAGSVIQLIWLPNAMVTPRWTESFEIFIDHYDYKPSGRTVALKTEDVVHFRNEPDPCTMGRTGVGPVKKLLREIYGDNVGAETAAQLLAQPLPGVIISPKGEVEMTEEDAKALKEAYRRNFTGAKRGEPMVNAVAIDVAQFGFDPEQLNLRNVRAIPEERISAIYGIPAVVVGLGAGLEHSTYNNVKEAREAAYESCIIPTQTSMSDQLDIQLLPDFVDARDNLRLDFNLENVRILQADEDAKSKRLIGQFASGIITQEEARQELGFTDAPQGSFRYELNPAAPAPTPAEPAPKMLNGRHNYDCDRGDHLNLRRLPGRKEALPEPEPQSELLSLAERFRSQLLRREARAVRDVLQAYGQAEKGILNRLDALIEKMEEAVLADEEISEAWLNQETRYRELLKQARDEMEALRGAAASKITDAQSALADDALAQTPKLAAAAAGAIPSGVSIDAYWNVLPKQALLQFIGFASDGSALEEVFNRFGSEAAADIRREMVEGLAAGENPKQIARNIRKSVDAKRWEMERITRTEVLRSYRESSRESYKANPSVCNGWTWLASLDSRTCWSCIAMNGTFHLQDEKLDDHCNGRCAMVPKTKSWAEITGDDSIADTRPQIQTGAAWFRELDQSEQRAILGDTLYDKYAAGEIDMTEEFMVTRRDDPRWGTMRSEASQQDILDRARAAEEQTAAAA